MIVLLHLRGPFREANRTALVNAHGALASVRPALLEQGDALFQTHENLEHLAMMEVALGQIPGDMIRRAECVSSSSLPCFVSRHPIFCCPNAVNSRLTRAAPSSGVLCIAFPPAAAATLRSISAPVAATGASSTGRRGAAGRRAAGR